MAPNHSTPFWQRFLEYADTVFEFLVDDYGFQRIPIVRPTSARTPQTSWYLQFGKRDVAVAPTIEVSGPLSVHVFKWDGNAPKYSTPMKQIYMLERLRCPSIRWSPEQREDRSEAGIRNTLAHDAMIIRDYFPDVLDGRFDLLEIDDLETVRRLIHR